ncbi:MAG TPA: hypothetical protein VIY29_02535, partial [Ktedonobacteraceae bacterium]
VLLGRSAQKLERVRAVCERQVQGVYPAIHIEATTDVRRGLLGADYVLNQVRVGGLEARAFDETFPREMGVPGEETIGPGGFANALRTIPAVLESLRIVEEVAPEAIVLNLTNPAGIVQHAASKYTKTRMIGLCDSPITLGDDVSKLLDLPRAQLEVGYVGMNHLGWIIALRHGQEDLMERALQGIERLAYLGVDAAYIRATRAIPIPYVRYYLHPEGMLAQQQGQLPRARQLQVLEQALLADYERVSMQHEAMPAQGVKRRGAVWYSAIVVPVLDALINDLGTTWVVNVSNGRLVPWLPADTVIEVPARIDRQGEQVHPLPVPGDLLVEELRLLLSAQAAYEELAVTAIVEGERELAVRSLVAHPLVRSLDRAERVLAAVWPSGGVAVG